MKIWKILLLGLALYTVNIFATTLSDKHVYIFHINGVNTEKSDAYANVDNLHKVYGNSAVTLGWDLLYNPTQGNLAADLWDVFRQKRQENSNLTLDDYVQVWMKAHNLNYSPDSEDYLILKSQIKQKYVENLDFVGVNLEYIINQFQDKTPYKNITAILKAQGNPPVLIIAHSQGNLYANQLYDYLIQSENYLEDNLKIYGIAPPSNFVRGREEENIGGSGYVSAKNDFVITSLRFFSKLLPATIPPLRPNIILQECGDVVCHSLIKAYLLDADSKQKIIEGISESISQLVSNSALEDRNNRTNKIRKNLLKKINSHDSSRMFT